MSAIVSMARQAQAAARQLRASSAEQRTLALRYMAENLIACRQAVLEANAADLAEAAHMPPAFQKRLKIDDKVFE